MAIDTQTKRQACINGVGHMFLSPPPDGEISATDIYFWVFLQVAVSEEEEIGDIEEKVNLILARLSARGFKRERPSRKELMDKMNTIWTEVVDLRRDLRKNQG